MLWSLIKIVVFLVLVALATIGASYLLDTEGGVRVAVAGTEFTLGPLQAVIALLVLLFAVWVVVKLVGLVVAFLRFLNGDETALTRYFTRNRERKGFQALADAVMALASGEGRVALSKADRAERYLHRPELTRLITAQAAEMVGDKRRAEEVYRALLADDRTRFVGVRGLMKQKLDDNDTETAFKLAEKAFALKPQHEETQDVLLRLQAQRHDWDGARRTLGAKLKHGSLPRDVHRRRDAVLALSAAREVAEEGKTVEAREAAIEANRLSPDLIPAAALAARQYIAQGKDRYAARVLKKAWEAQPHPELAAAFAEIRPDETPEQRLKRFNALTRTHPSHPETRMLDAELHIAAEDFPGARRALGDLVTSHPSARAMTLMAAIERGEGASDDLTRGWLTRALSAPRGPQWVCDKCQNIEMRWTPVCGNCGAFDTMTWREPPSGEVVLPTGGEMLPLLVGTTEGAPTSVPAPDAAATGGTTSPGGPATPDATTPGDVPPVGADRRPTATSVPEAEVIVPQDQRDEANATKK
ncbi:heme biosynthesis protein HemY [Mesobaculum littorinae]|uniref:Heme biosynthesis protein HemY n=1 Tax=Mesobaculum littorinae TaxID=2486419 RepID=A0A438AGZ3_9RHOB|nr:heme biosynthesis HemY N-terminal domain-containing protein [Mesobaculum littorinae]RVV97983.1 heme biosynthesis protein HemY [Mesobaculum littorinae]